MIGAILGDMIGSVYEFDRGNKTKEFPLFVRKSQFTDDSVMTIAVAEGLMEAGNHPDPERPGRCLAACWPGSKMPGRARLKCVRSWPSPPADQRWPSCPSGRSCRR